MEFLYIYLLSFQGTSSEVMERENVTVLTEFVLVGLPLQAQWEVSFFFVFLVMYLITITGNFGLITHLEIPSPSHTHVPIP